MNNKCGYDFNKKLFQELVKQTDTNYKDLAKKIGISEASLIQYLSGKATPMISAMIKISDYFQIPIDVLMNRCTLEEYDEIIKGNAEFMYKCRKAAFENYLIRKKSRGTIVDDALKHSEVYYAPYPYNLIDCIFDEPIDEVLNDDQLAGFEQALDTLHPRERRALELYFEEEKTLKEIGKEFGVTQERIRQIVSKAIRKMRNPIRVKLIRNGPKMQELQRLEQIEAEIVARKERINERLAELEQLENQANDKMEDLRQRTAKTLVDRIDDLDLSVRSYNCLRRANCDTITQIIDLFENGKIFGVRNLGKKSIAEIIDRISETYPITFNPVLDDHGFIVSYKCVHNFEEVS